MEIGRLKEYVVQHNKIEDILLKIGCHHIKYHSSSGYYSACNKDGDNPQAIIIYCNDNLTCINYTRQMIQGDRQTDLIDLVCFNEDVPFPKALKIIADVCGIDYYYDFDKDIPESLQITKLIKDMDSGFKQENDDPVKPIDPNILQYYKPYVNDMFLKDGITYETQQLFGVGYDEQTNRITIPIYSELGDLVGVKGRLFKDQLDNDEQKYIYLKKVSKGKVLYGLNVTYDSIIRNRSVFVVEAEKGVMQCYSYGFTNAVATAGKKITKFQIDMLTRLGVDVIFAYDKDVDKCELTNIANMFIPQVNIYAVIDNDNILNEKESPTDSFDKWKLLTQNMIFRIR